MEIYDDDGHLVRATFHSEFQDGQPTVLFVSCGGSEPNRINAEYNFGLQLVLQRLGLGGATLLNVAVESEKAMDLPLHERQVTIDEAAYPIDLTRWPDFRQLRVGIGRGSARVARDPNSSSDGNRQKTLRLFVSFSRTTPITREWLDALISQISGKSAVDEVVTTSAADAGATRAARVSYARIAAGQGRSMNHLRNRAVEMHAMDGAKSYFSSEQGGAWTVTDVSSQGKGYDLHCIRGNDQLRVEVKGTVGAGTSVILTKNEVNQAHEHPETSILFLVCMIDAEERDGQWICRGGYNRILRRWDPRARGQLEVEQYKYTLPAWSDDEE